jgi:WD40 repeat protein
VQVWDTATGQQTGKTFVVRGIGPATAAALSPDGKTLAVAQTGSGGGGVVDLWDVAAGQQIGPGLPVNGIGATSVAFASDGKTLAIVSDDGAVRLWDLATRRPVGKTLSVARGGAAGGAGGTGLAAFTPDGTMAAINNPSGYGPVQLWDVANGKQAARSFASHFGPINWLALSPDGKTLAIGAASGVAQMWDVSTGQAMSSISTDASNGAVFSPDGAVLATGVIGVDSIGPVRLWDVATGQPIGDQLGTGAMAFSPDGKTLAIVSDDGPVRLWDVSYLTDPLATLCADIGGAVTSAQWAQYVPAGPAYRNACP